MNNCRFIQRTNEPDYVSIDPYKYPNSCRSRVGKKTKGGKQIVRAGNCKINGTFHRGRIMHELMHVAGIKFIYKVL